MKTFLGKVQLVEGRKRLVLNAPIQFQIEIKKYPEGKELALRLDDRKAKRSNAQNSYLWGVVYQLISETTGYTVNEVHEWGKRKFLPKKDIIIGSVLVQSTKSTTELNKNEMTEYIESLRSFAVNFLDCTIPTPEDGGYSRTEAILL